MTQVNQVDEIAATVAFRTKKKSEVNVSKQSTKQQTGSKTA